METFNAGMDISCLERFFRIAPAETRKATSRLLNDQAFSYRELGPKVLAERLIIRNASFVQAMFRVQKADAGKAPNQQRATAGSIRTDRFSGWSELVDGKEPARKRLMGLNARSGDYGKKVPTKNRLASGMQLEGPDNYSEIPERMRVMAMISILARNPDYTNGTGMFIITGGNWVPGVYKFKSRDQWTRYSTSKKQKVLRDNRTRTTRDRPKVTRIQTFDKAPKTKRYDWPGITLTRLKAWFNPADTWSRYFNDIIRKAIK